MSSEYDVFISYHGGQVESENSSYSKASELKDFLEERGLKVFLCKDQHDGDFYDSINEAIIGSKHFILVACDKTKLSKWIYDEVKQFDSLRKNGQKPNCIINAYVFGDLQPSDLFTFNTVFTSVDIKTGDTGFEELYQQIAKKNPYLKENKNRFSTDSELKKVKYLDMTNFEVEEKIFECIKGMDPSQSDYWSDYVKELFGFYNVSSIFQYINRIDDDCDVLIVKLYRHYIINCLLNVMEIDDSIELDYIVFVADDGTTDPNTIVDVKNKKIGTVSERFTLKYNNGTVTVDCDKDKPSINNITIETQNSRFDEIEILPQEGDEDIPVTVIEIDDSIRARNDYIEIYESDFLTFVLGSIVNKFRDEKWIDEETSSFFRYVFAEPYDQIKVKTVFDNIYKRLIVEENSILSQYRTFKRTGSFTNSGIKDTTNQRYLAIVEKIRTFYLSKDQNSLIDAISLLEIERGSEMKKGSHYKQQSLLLIIAELVMNNVYSFESNPSSFNNIIEELKTTSSREIISDYRDYLNTIVLSIQKEMIFSGVYASISNSIPSALNLILSNMTKQIDMLTAQNDNREMVVSQLFLLYRQRAVIWEHLGDSTAEYNQRMDYYRSWRDDTLNAIKYGNEHDSDREILGCAYLNYASSSNRLACTKSTVEEKKNDYSECLKNLDTAYSILRGNSAKRYIGYVHLHRADCYSEMFESKMYDNEQEIIRLMNISSRKANDIFRDTQDLIGRGWSLRLMAKAIIHSEEGDLKVRLVDGLNKLKTALTVDTEACVIKEISRCVKDFSIYLGMIDANMLSSDMDGLIKQIFSSELKAFMTVVRDVGLEYSDIGSVQGSLTTIMEKLLE